jgi:phosphonoacetaldehyde hydrolase
VDDTVPGIAEGVSAGCLTVGVALSGNYVGKTAGRAWRHCRRPKFDKLREAAAVKLKAAGADHVIDTVADLPTLLDRL